MFEEGLDFEFQALTTVKGGWNWEKQRLRVRRPYSHPAHEQKDPSLLGFTFPQPHLTPQLSQVRERKTSALEL